MLKTTPEICLGKLNKVCRQLLTRDHINRKYFGVGTVIAFILVVLLIPVILYPFGIAGDYPNHYVAFNIGFEKLQNAQPHSYYQVQWGLFPHLAMAVLAIPVFLGADISLVFHLFLVASAAMPVVGAVTIHCQIHQKASWSLLLSLVLVYNLCLYVGFLDFNFSLGLAFCLYALLLRREDRPTNSGAIILAFGAAILFLSHLLGFLIFLLLLASQQIQSAITRSGYRERVKTLLSPLIWLWPTAILVAIWMINGPETLPQEKLDIGVPQLGMLLRAFWGPFYFSDNLPAVFLAPLFLLFLPCALIIRLLTAERKHLVALGTLILVTIILSQRVGGVVLDFRLGMATFLFASAIVRLETIDNFSKRVVAVISTFFLIFGLTLQGFIAWPKLQATHYETLAIREALQKLPEKSRLFAGNSAESRNFLHTGAFIALDRDGFFPQMFQVVQPIRARKPFASINMPGMEMDGDRLVASVLEPPTEAKGDAWFNLDAHHGWPLRFDFLIWFSTSEGQIGKFDFLEKIAEGKHFYLYRIDRKNSNQQKPKNTIK